MDDLIHRFNASQDGHISPPYHISLFTENINCPICLQTKPSSGAVLASARSHTIMKISKIHSIRDMAVFKQFDWNDHVKYGDNTIATFKDINILYGRNYSGKTTLSRIFRALEVNGISDKLDSAQFCLELEGGAQRSHESIGDNRDSIRVYNEDFVRDNLKFISHPDEGVEPFAILGEDNAEIEAEITAIERTLGLNQEGGESELYLKLRRADVEWSQASDNYQDREKELEDKLKVKATDRNEGIKYRANQFGDQNYDSRKLKLDIESVQDPAYSPLNEQESEQLNSLIAEQQLAAIDDFISPP